VDDERAERLRVWAEVGAEADRESGDASKQLRAEQGGARRTRAARGREDGEGSLRDVLRAEPVVSGLRGRGREICSRCWSAREGGVVLGWWSGRRVRRIGRWWRGRGRRSRSCRGMGRAATGLDEIETASALGGAAEGGAGAVAASVLVWAWRARWSDRWKR
jgi:hypothetical protein